MPNYDFTDTNRMPVSLMLVDFFEQYYLCGTED